MKKLIFFAIIGIFMSACSNSGNTNQPASQSEQNEVVITNDLENAMGVIPSWQNENRVIEMTEPKAHSGNYACITNDTAQYSYTFRELFKNIRSGTPKMANLSGWIYTTVANPDFSIICSVNQNNQTYDWKAYPLKKELSESGKWVEFSTNFFFSKPITSEDEIWIFGWNQGKNNVYIDDLKITFSY
jgi:hypothetical protein